ncbi:MAG: hypothetical protein BWX50_01157 [Euryarchaeota archaeon ADurb.Bin009]|nr:MAG: hypothetical protein BWX50_01157 [Euryarchaeota archaeon ADurb.Bin009]
MQGRKSSGQIAFGMTEIRSRPTPNAETYAASEGERVTTRSTRWTSPCSMVPRYSVTKRSLRGCPNICCPWCVRTVGTPNFRRTTPALNAAQL